LKSRCRNSAMIWAAAWVISTDPLASVPGS
jgi:hypothetical protein